MTARGGKLIAGLLALALLASGCQWVAIASVGPGGVPANFGSTQVRLSDDGRYAVFVSGATNLTADPAGIGFQVYRHDFQTGVTDMVSKQRDCGGSCVGPNGPSSFPDISEDGAYIVFESDATNLVSGDADTNGASDIFIVFTDSDTILRIKFATGEFPSDSRRPSVKERTQEENPGALPALYVAFDTDAALQAEDTNGVSDVYLAVYSLFSGLLLQSVSDLTGNAGNGPSSHGLVSGDGTTVAFRSEATDLTSDGLRWLWKRTGGANEPLLSAFGAAATDDAQPRGISDDGAVVAFWASTPGFGAGFDSWVGFAGTFPAGGATFTNHLDIAIDGSGSRVVRLGTDGVARLSDLVDAAFPVPDEVVSTDPVGSVISSNTIFSDLSADGRTAAFITDDALLASDTNIWNDVHARAVPAVIIDAITPSSIPVGVETPITISGTGFYADDMSLSIRGVTVNNFQVIDGHTITAKVVPFRTGDREVSLLLRNPAVSSTAGIAHNCPDCLTVIP